MKLPIVLTFAVFSTAVPTITFAAPAPIGVVSASGHFNLEGSRVWGNSTLFDGARVETTEASSQLALSNGAKVQLGAASSARVFDGHLELERGMGQVNAKSAFRVNASGMTVEGSRYRVAVASSVRMEVTALEGTARVLNARGAVLRTIPAGSSISFVLQQSITRSGCLLWKNTGFILQVDDSPEVLELTGEGLSANVGSRVRITGLPSAAQASITPAASVVTVNNVTRTSNGGCLTAAAALTAQTQMPAVIPTPTAPGAPALTPAASGGGMSAGAKTAIIVGIGGGGAAGAFVALKGKKDSTSR